MYRYTLYFQANYKSDVDSAVIVLSERIRCFSESRRWLVINNMSPVWLSESQQRMDLSLISDSH